MKLKIIYKNITEIIFFNLLKNNFKIINILFFYLKD